MADLTFYLLVAAVVFGISALATWCVRQAADRFGLLERPRPDRWHTAVRPKLGGVGIFVALVAGIGLFAPLGPDLAAFVLLSGVMFLVGLLDDFRSLKPQTKLVAQIAVALTLFFLGFHFNPAVPYAVDLAFVVLWVVGITNAMNLLDNMDGLSAGIAVIAGGFRFLLFYTDGNPEGALLTAVYVGAVAGFLLFNFGPASIFMGNCGSFLIGFSLAALNLTTAQTYAKSLLSILLFPVLVLAIPIFDTTFVSLTRYFSGRSLSRGGADHTSHRLVAVGLSERQAVLILYGISLAAGIVAYVLYRVGFSYAVFGAALCVLGLAVFGIYLSSVAVYPEDRLPREARDARPGFTLFTELTYKRASLWILVDVLTLATAYYGAYLLRFGGSARWEEQFAIFARSSPLFVAAVLVSLFARGLYRAEWKHFSLHEIKIVLTGATLGTLAATLLFTYLFSFTGFSRGVLVVAWGAAVLSLSGTRVFVRLLAEALRVERAGAQRVLLYGAGAAGRLALTELQTNRERNQHVVGFLDDAVFKHGSTIQGVPVLGGLDSLEFLVRKHRIEAVVVSTRTIADGRQARLAALAARCGVAVYRVSLDVVLLERNAG